MSGEITLTVSGNLTKAPEQLKSNNIGVTFTIASTKRQWNRQAGQMQDVGTVYMRCVAWGDLATHILQTADKGMRVIVIGELAQRSYRDQQGNNRQVTELNVHDFGPSLQRATAQVTRIKQANGFVGNQPTQANNRYQNTQSRNNTYNQPPQQYNTNGQQADQFGQLNSGYRENQTNTGVAQNHYEQWNNPAPQNNAPVEPDEPEF